LPDGTTHTARLEPGGNPTLPQRLVAEPALDPAQIGQPVQIRILKQTGWLGTALASLRAQFASAKKAL
jgi:hypothetical protein